MLNSFALPIWRIDSIFQFLSCNSTSRLYLRLNEFIITIDLSSGIDIYWFSLDEESTGAYTGESLYLNIYVYTYNIATGLTSFIVH